jgi:hypothetical protein
VAHIGRFSREDKKSVYEWDYKKGEVEIFRKSNGEHLGGFNHLAGERNSPPDPNKSLKK